MSQAPFRRLVPCALAAALPLLWSGASAAQEAEPGKPGPDWSRTLSLQDLLDLEIASASKLPQTSRDAPGQATVVTRQTLREYGWGTIEDVLFRQPGFFPSHESERSTVGARGLFEGWNNNHLLVLVDGAPFNDCEAATAYTTALTPLFLARDLEIVRGPGSALYGSSATGGVVSLNTVSAARMLGESGSLEASSLAAVRIGDAGTRALDVLGATRSRWASAVLAFNHSETSGNEYDSFDGSGRVDAQGRLQTFRVHDSRHSDYFFLKLEGREALSGLQLEYHLQSWDYEPGHGWLWWAPDLRLPLEEQRHLINLRWRGALAQGLDLEALGQVQRHHLDLQMRLYPDGALGLYPAGVTESQSYSTQETFARAQLSWRPGADTSLLAGVEGSAFEYDGDEMHTANAYLDDVDNGSPAATSTVRLGDTYQPIRDELVWSVAPYAQLQAQQLFGLPLSLTAGLRYDARFFHYKDPDSGARRSMSLEHLSPRVALVLSPLQALSIKAQASRAFRAPSVTELFSSHSWAQSSNLDVRGEQITTFELGFDWTIGPHLGWRMDAFNTRTADNILYSDTTNQLLNLRSVRVAGLEAELLGEVPLGEGQSLSGFANWTFVHQLSEQTYDPAVPASSALAWAPEQSVKAGVAWRNGRFTASLQGLYQGEVRRRANETSDPHRPASVAPWTRFDLNARVRVAKGLSLGLKVTNLFDTEGYFVKSGAFPFDYRVEPRRVLGVAELEL
jgi:iron complex outermembrane receptor protein